ncbi:MAG: TonB-dependent receptor plug domain-containing protein, partial [Paludibacteraceae bacterium]|nr:TonB-dependent receptor plug domain-containing protein [Paludibacteraceae bacterium]
MFSTLNNEDIIKSQASNITQLLSGQMAGVQAITPSGQPGTISSLRIRGIGSMDALCEPLYVIDGIPSNPQAVSTLSNSDIESVHVLKDAMATA